MSCGSGVRPSKRWAPSTFCPFAFSFGFTLNQRSGLRVTVLSQLPAQSLHRPGRLGCLTQLRPSLLRHTAYWTSSLRSGILEVSTIPSRHQKRNLGKYISRKRTPFYFLRVYRLTLEVLFFDFFSTKFFFYTLVFHWFSFVFLCKSNFNFAERTKIAHKSLITARWGLSRYILDFIYFCYWKRFFFTTVFCEPFLVCLVEETPCVTI